MKSDKLMHYTGRYFFLVFSLIFFINSIISITDGFKLGDWDSGSIIGFAIAGTIFLIPFLYLKDKFTIIEFGNQKLKIYSGLEIIEVTWLDVESIEPFRLSSPPIYILRLNNRKGFFLFGTSQGSFSIGGLIIDNSDIGVLIEKKKRDFDI